MRCDVEEDLQAAGQHGSISRVNSASGYTITVYESPRTPVKDAGFVILGVAEFVRILKSTLAAKATSSPEFRILTNSATGRFPLLLIGRD